jgi:hypothetical protein
MAMGDMLSAAAMVPLAMQGMHMDAHDGAGAGAGAKGEQPSNLRIGNVAPSVFGDLACYRTLSGGIWVAHIGEESKVDPTSEVCMDSCELACQLVQLAEEVKMADTVGVVGVAGIVGAVDVWVGDLAGWRAAG